MVSGKIFLDQILKIRNRNIGRFLSELFCGVPNRGSMAKLLPCDGEKTTKRLPLDYTMGCIDLARMYAYHSSGSR